tara:strand:- start:30956 stop:32413 length:1458 start_codon:yes stop_codon:yes gene_type:complete
MPPIFDELHVVSDLHIGGVPGFQIFNQGARLAAFIRALPNDPQRAIALVLGGDIVDFLAEPNASYFDPQGAVAKLQDIFERDAFSPILPALQDFLAIPGRTLVLILGNHDVELALPPVLEWLQDTLSRGEAGVRERIVVGMNGEGYRCLVGNKTVLCVHGNEVDSWNAIDYTSLGEQATALTSNQPLPTWDANAGTRMVVDVINEVKKKFPVVDLLKPEFGAAAPMVVALDPASLLSIGKILRIVRHIPAYTMRLGPGLFAAEAKLASDAPSTSHTILSFAEEHLDHEDVKHESKGFFSRAYHALTKHDGPAPLHELHDLVTSIQGWFDPKRRPAQLRKHLKKSLVDDRSFDIEDPDEQFTLLDDAVSNDVNYLIAGHTHLERSIQRSTEGCYYFNSGTWTRLIQLTHEILDNDDEFAQVYQSFLAGDIRALDDIHNLGSDEMSLVLIRPTVVSIVNEDGVVFGELRHAADDGTLHPLAGSRRGV